MISFPSTSNTPAPSVSTSLVSTRFVGKIVDESIFPRSGLVTSGVGGISLSSCGLVLHKGDVTSEDYTVLFRNVMGLHKASCWLVGDILLLADRKWGNRYSGSKYKEASKATGLTHSALRNIVLTCRRFPLEKRHPKLSFTHHQEVAHTTFGAAERAAILEKAEREKMSCATLRKYLRQLREPDTAPTPKAPQRGFCFFFFAQF